MKKTLQLLVLLGISTPSGWAQTTPPAQQAATAAAVAKHRAQSYAGPKVVENTKELGQKFRQHSKPANVAPKKKPWPK